MQTVVIVNAGGWGDLSAAQGSYDGLVESLQSVLERAEGQDLRGNVYKAAQVHVARSVEEALAKLDGHGVLVFVTRGMLGEARRIKGEYPKIRVVVFTGDVPDDEVRVVSKGWVLSSAQLEHMIFDS